MRFFDRNLIEGGSEAMAQKENIFKINVVNGSPLSKSFDWVLSRGFLLTRETIRVQRKGDIGAIP